MHQIPQGYYQKCIDTKSDLLIALLQIRSTPQGPGLSCPATGLFNCPIRDIMPIVNRPVINSNNSDQHKDDQHYEAVVKRQTKDDKNHDTFRNYASFPLGSTVVVQCKDGGQWTHDTVVGTADYNLNNRSYMICITKTSQIVTRNI